MFAIPPAPLVWSSARQLGHCLYRTASWLPRTIFNRPADTTPPPAPPAFGDCSSAVQRAVRGLCAAQATRSRTDVFARFAADDCTNLAATDLRELRRTCERTLHGMRNTGTNTLDAFRLRALHDFSQAGIQQLRLRAESDRRAHALRRAALPGAEQSTSVSMRLGAGVGLPSLFGASADVAAANASQQLCFETLEYAEGQLLTGSVSAGVGTTAEAGMIRARAEAGASTQHAVFAGAETAQAFAHHHARHAAASPSRFRWRRPFRRATDLHGPADAHAKALRGAMYWTNLLPALMKPADHDAACRLPSAASGPHASPCWGSAVAPLMDARLASSSATLAAHAGIDRCGASATVTCNGLTVDLQVPAWLPDMALAEDERSALASDLLQQLTLWLAATDSAACIAMATLLAQSSAAQTPDARSQLLGQLRAEWGHLQALLAHHGHGPDDPHLRRVIRSVCRSWNCRSAQDVFARMLQVCHWIGLVAASTPASDTTESDRDQASQLANEIRASPAMRQDPEWMRRLHATRHQQQRFRRHGITVGATLSLPGTDAGATISVVHTEQANYNALRDGHYIEVTLQLGGVLDAEGIAAALREHVPDIPPLPPLDLPPSLTGALAALEGASRLSLAFRFFRPSFQQDPGFPAAARGHHLQQLRCTGVTSLAAAATLPLPVVPGVQLELGVGVSRQTIVPLHADIFYAGSMTATLLRYQSLLGQGLDNHAAWDRMLDDHRGSLQRLVEALQAADSSAAAEAVHWLQKRSPARVKQGPATLVMQAAGAASDPRLAALQVLFDALLPPLAEAQRNSPLCEALRLPGPPPPMVQVTRL